MRKQAYIQERKEKLALQLRLDDAKSTLDQINVSNSALKRASQLDEKEAEVNLRVMHEMKLRMEKAENELERLKPKRTDSISPERVITDILKRPGASPLSANPAARADSFPATAQPEPKKSRNRKDRWN